MTVWHETREQRARDKSAGGAATLTPDRPQTGDAHARALLRRGHEAERMAYRAEATGDRASADAWRDIAHAHRRAARAASRLAR